MRLLHTADWHAGRSLHGLDRTAEVGEVVDEIAGLAVDRAVDLLLISGDLFDGKTPSAAAEAVVYRFFLRLAEAGIPSVVIAGNHDSPARLDAVSRVLGLAGVRVVGTPRVAGQGGVFELDIGGERARIAALPFISERRIVRVEQLLAGDGGQQREGYQQGMRKLIRNLTQGFTADAVNLLVMHATMEGAVLANSEYAFHSTEAYTLGADLLPENANYVALGHIHKPQAIRGFPAHAARYAGSVLQLDFGEQGDRKSVTLLDAGIGRPTEILEEIPLRAGKRLKRVRMAEEELERRSVQLAEFDGWLKLVLTLESFRPGLKDRLLATLPNVLSVELELPEVEGPSRPAGVDLQRLTLLEAFERFYLDTRGDKPPASLRSAFQELHDELREEASEFRDEPIEEGRSA